MNESNCVGTAGSGRGGISKSAAEVSMVIWVVVVGLCRRV
jgi:hypothetical protein